MIPLFDKLKLIKSKVDMKLAMLKSTVGEIRTQKQQIDDLTEINTQKDSEIGKLKKQVQYILQSIDK